MTKGPGLCHGTAGNAYAFLTVHARTGQAVWLDRARVFAAHALEQVRAHRAEAGIARGSPYTGDVGVGHLFAALLDGLPGLPLLDVP